MTHCGVSARARICVCVLACVRACVYVWSQGEREWVHGLASSQKRVRAHMVHTRMRACTNTHTRGTHARTKVSRNAGTHSCPLGLGVVILTRARTRICAACVRVDNQGRLRVHTHTTHARTHTCTHARRRVRTHAQTRTIRHARATCAYTRARAHSHAHTHTHEHVCRTHDACAHARTRTTAHRRLDRAVCGVQEKKMVVCTLANCHPRRVHSHYEQVECPVGSPEHPPVRLYILSIGKQMQQVPPLTHAHARTRMGASCAHTRTHSRGDTPHTS